TNHHWGSGVVFYLVNQVFDFKGLSVLYILMNILALFFMAMAASLKSNRVIAALSVLFVVPLLAYRVEVRPEGFSYALLGAYFLLFSAFSVGKISFKKLLIPLVLMQILWVNLHIFFFLGILVSGVFLLESVLIKKDPQKTKQFAIITCSLVLASLINPHFLNGLLAPLTIFNEYGYMVAENQTLFFMQDRFADPVFYHLEFFAIISILLIIFQFIKKQWKQSLVPIILALAFLFLSVIAVRGIPLFALFFIPLSAAALGSYIDGLNYKSKESVLKFIPYLGIVFCVIFIPMKGTYASAQKGYEALGLIPNIDGCGKFIRANKLPGRIFNNYDFGSYLIYHLHNSKKVFVDNRPEAYSVAFFDSIYRPMQQNAAIWKTKSLEYDINLIVFYRHDNTPWGQDFLIRITQDPDWVAIYVDGVSIILIRNIASNEKWIRQFGLSREMFRGVPN
ncbi:MAG: hypothetical protein JKX84_09420, partial [Flavobacteriales bacterium]|nr:hypothetical protein [Flavobacteriales bacterium]